MHSNSHLYNVPEMGDKENKENTFSHLTLFFGFYFYHNFCVLVLDWFWFVLNMMSKVIMVKS